MVHIETKQKTAKEELQAPPGTEAYDYIMCGGGCAGLSLVVHMIHSGQFTDKRILIIDQDAKKQNDRTWCFWEKEQGLFEPIVRKQWKHLHFHAPQFSTKLSIEPYTYKLIQGLDFYNHCLSLIALHSNIRMLQAKVKKIDRVGQGAVVHTDDEHFFATYVFNSIMLNPPRLAKDTIWMLQHFKGWYIKTAQDAFEPSAGTLMDFRTGQGDGTTFFYVLPFSKSEALVEYTLFSNHVLDDAAYETALTTYIQQRLGLTGYTIIEKEFGVIPMTNYRFPSGEGPIVPIGTAGGYTKGSSGYTFQFIQKSSQSIVQRLIQNGNPHGLKRSHKRFLFYDAVLLQVLQDKAVDGASIFTLLFQKNDPQLVLKFLDNETTLAEEIKIISTLPVLPFTKAALKQMF